MISDSIIKLNDEDHLAPLSGASGYAERPAATEFTGFLGVSNGGASPSDCSSICSLMMSRATHRSVFAQV